jgi:hypothetical protein
MWLSKRAQSIKPSPTLAIESKAKALKAQGIDVISFGAGEPDFGTPDHIKEAGRQAISAGFTKYCPVAGTPDLKAAIIEKFRRDNGLEYRPEEIIVSCGAKHSLYNLFQAILNPGDELIVPSPYWVSYPDMAYLAGAKVRFVRTKEADGFKMSAEALRAAIRPKTKAVVINSPSNPTGGTYTAAELQAKFAGASPPPAGDGGDGKGAPPALLSDEHFKVAGRIVALRGFGKAAFAKLLDRTGEIQVWVRKDLIGDAAFELWKKVERGDFVGVVGSPTVTKPKSGKGV